MNRRRVYFDFEFYEDGTTIEPISVGMVDEQGFEYYAVFKEISKHFSWRRVVKHDFLREHVVPHLPLLPEYGQTLLLDVDHPDVKPKEQIRQEILDFLLPDEPGEDAHLGIALWAWFSAYDHVTLAQLWGPMMSLPPGIPMRTGDLAQEADRLGVTILPQQKGIVHHALHDARHGKEIAEFLAAQNEAWLDEYYRKRRREEDGHLMVVSGSATVHTTVLMPEGSVPEDNRRLSALSAVPVAETGDELHEYDIRYLSAMMEEHRRQIMAKLREVTGTSTWDGEVKSPEISPIGLPPGMFKPENGD